MIARIVCVATLLAISAAPRKPDGNWERLFELPEGQAWLETVWADGKYGWVAGGRDVIIFNRAKETDEVSVSAIPGLAVTALGATSRGVYGVGSHGAIWRIDRDRAHLEHQERPTEKRRLRDPDQLLQVGDAVVAGKAGVLAVGTRALFSSRLGEWAAVAGPTGGQLVEDRLFGHWFSRPKGCDSITWLVSARSHREGVLVCGDRRVFGVRDQDVKPLPPLPKGCAEVWHAAGGATWGTTILCGGKGLVWKQDGPAAWSQVPAPANLDNIAATESCIFAVSRRSLWRRCEVKVSAAPESGPESPVVQPPKLAAPEPRPTRDARGCSTRL